MGLLSRDWSRIHRTKSLGPLSIPLAACSVPYAVASRFRWLAYEHGLFKRKSLPGVVVSIGNLTAGGTGKTPLTAMLAKWAHAKGYGVAVLSRGYGGNTREKVLEASDGKNIKASPSEAGDEPYLLAKKLPSVPVVISKKRYHAGMFACERHGSNFFILDDGFQHMALERDLDLVLLDASEPFGNGRLLPWGPLREPISQLSRADAFILTRTSPYDRNIPDVIKRKFPSTPVFHADHVPSELVFPHSSEARDPGSIQGEPVVAFAGIAHPELFAQTLHTLAARVVLFKGFRDHYRYTKEDIEALLRIKERVGARYLITTEKDWVRIAQLNVVSPEIAYLDIEFAFLSGYDEFIKIVEDCIK